MKIIAGLGNPGREYENTRHNVGFRTVDEVSRRHSLPCGQKKFKSLFGSGVIEGERCVLLKPQTYMNLSGEAIRAAVDFFDVPLEEILVVCDDFHLSLGKLRMRRGGSSGGQKGIRSIIDMLGTDLFPRLRVGIGDVTRGDPKDFVLSPFRRDEREAAEDAILRAADAVETWVRHGIEAGMNEFN
ncbi:MAG: aminoacyl-tRNA hydrolase [Planctomycetes bacterium]|nr:aminoacyl-tRNA hydrolase [Planctomycetota bacterium]